MKISDEAVIAASKALMADKMSNHSGDNAPQIMDACEKVARKVLEAAAPHMLAEAQAVAWDRAVGSMVYDDGTPLEIMSNSNPYRSAK